MTTRGWLFFVLILGLLGLGLLGRVPAPRFFLGLTPHLFLIGLTLLIWFASEWLLLTIRSNALRRGLVVTRQIHDQHGPVETLWAGRTFGVRITVRWQSSLALPHAAITDWVPFGVERLSGSARYEGPIKNGQTVQLAYQVRADRMGRIRFEGVQIQLADLQGFFLHVAFLRLPLEFRVLPVLVNESGQPASAKRFSLLPPPGPHRLRKPGSGSELLDLRDYVPGDPPRTIAWKISARRDKLITKEFETEVPIRCTLFVDTGNSVRLGSANVAASFQLAGSDRLETGRHSNALGLLIEIAASVAQANSAAKDLTGLCLFDDSRATVVRPARASGHLARLLKMLADAAALAPSIAHGSVQTVLPQALALAQQLYPDLLRPEVNRVPFWMPWWWPVPLYPRPRSLFNLVGRWVIMAIAFLPFVLLAVLVYLLLSIGDLLLNAVLDEQVPGASVRLDAVYEYFCLFTAGIAIGYAWLLYRWHEALFLFFSATKRRHMRWRKQMAALLSSRAGLAPGGLALLMEDDGRMLLELQRFLADHHVPYAPPLYDEEGRYLFAAPGKLDVLAKELVRAVARGRDNELFVLLVDLHELDDHLEPLLRAVRLALGRHHQVVLIAPIDAASLPRNKASLPRNEASLPRQRGEEAPPHPASTATQTISDILTTKLRRSHRRIRRTFARLGVPVLDAHGEESVALLLERMDRLRTLRRKG